MAKPAPELQKSSAAPRRLARVWLPALLLLAVALSGIGCAQGSRPRNVVLIVLDTLRADRVSAYGHERPTTPRIDELAGRGVIFETAVSNASWTLPSMVGMLTAEFPTRAEYDQGLQYSLVEQLRESGWKTAGFCGGGFAGRNYGIDLGFDRFEEQSPAGMIPFHEADAPADPPAEPSSGTSGIEKTFADARRWLERNHTEPFFLLVHTFEPHTPYDRRLYTQGMDRGALPETFTPSMAALIRNGWEGIEVTQKELDYIGALYDGGVTTSDRFVGELLDTLTRLGVEDETLVVVTADHGEDLGERDPVQPGIHGHALWDSLILVPLVFFDPTREFPVRRVAAQVRLIDTLPTIFDLLGLEPRMQGAGRSLLPLAQGVETEDRLAWSVVDRQPMFQTKKSQYAVRSSTHKLIVTPRPPRGEHGGTGRKRRVELYDLISDPQEKVDVSAEEPELVERMLADVDAQLARIKQQGGPRYRRKSEIDAETRQRLRELGYAE